MQKGNDEEITLQNIGGIVSRIRADIRDYRKWRRRVEKRLSATATREDVEGSKKDAQIAFAKLEAKLAWRLFLPVGALGGLVKLLEVIPAWITAVWP